ncbi:uncharacterized protein CANTADRAFT_6204 [Suhomyces tanzawaensis NRRL Y-17324]|uniref:C2H2-type domain-containing protein n=1 Tax=Suhomyces tanzawaensis NRRL Y-17324 TaxID=984487 RepID=A0A1E4SHN9_9ASCO|nr:uncharacterized protein CANTADRAFT_6204 [Suhomyces tanzawaensis NRRL Y-17324]ODV79013.1 hypothetical protein CANTADRAFT_6204 [Suhomyces tanzawaensis NRRL Y-17324]
MAKAEVGSAKYQSKKLKAAGLQKLKFYCQICEKQCRDANGFKNHLAAPSHHFRVKELSDSGRGGQVIENYSAQLRSAFLRLLRINHGTKKINANKFYQEYILSDRDHIHMNSTKWSSLTAFVKFLGSSGDVKVENADDSSELNLEISLIDNSPEVQQRQQQKNKEKNLRSDDEIALKLIHDQIEKGKKITQELEEGNNEGPQKLQPVSGKVSLKLKGLAKGPTKRATAFGNDDESDSEEEKVLAPKKTNIGNISKRLFQKR